MADSTIELSTRSLVGSNILPEESFPIDLAASTKVLQGTMAGMNSAGRLIPAGLTAGGTAKVLGVFSETVDNSAGSAGAKKTKVKYGVYKFRNSASTDLIAKSDIGALCYCVDNQTVAKTTGSDTRTIAGVIFDVASDGDVYVSFFPGNTL